MSVLKRVERWERAEEGRERRIQAAVNACAVTMPAFDTVCARIQLSRPLLCAGEQRAEGERRSRTVSAGTTADGAYAQA